VKLPIFLLIVQGNGVRMAVVPLRHAGWPALADLGVKEGRHVYESLVESSRNR